MRLKQYLNESKLISVSPVDFPSAGEYLGIHETKNNIIIKRISNIETETYLFRKVFLVQIVIDLKSGKNAFSFYKNCILAALWMGVYKKTILISTKKFAALVLRKYFGI